MAYQKILVAIDDSEISDNVIQQAAQLAKALNSEITLVQVMTLDPYLADAYLRMGQSNELIERVRSYVQENLTKAEKKFEAWKAEKAKNNEGVKANAATAKAAEAKKRLEAEKEAHKAKAAELAKKKAEALEAQVAAAAEEVATPEVEAPEAPVAE